MRTPVLLTLLLASSASGSAQYPDVHYDPIDLGTLGGTASIAHEAHGVAGFSDRLAVGEAQTPSGEWHPFLWVDGQMQDLGTLGGPLGSVASMNLFGVLVGHADAPGLPGEFPRAFRWDASNGLQDLGDLGGGRSWATAIDLYGESICGNSALPGGDVHGFFRDGIGSTLVDIGTLGGSTSYADDVDGQAVVGGALTSTSAMHAFFWHPGMGMVDLGTLGGSNSRAKANANGSICGWSTTVSGETHAFHTDTLSSPIADMGTLGGTISVALGLNTSNQVVGYSELADGSLHAFYWDDLGQKMVDLNDKIPEHRGWVLEAATSIDSFGYISGHGIHNGVRRAFLLRPFRLEVVGFAGMVNELEVLACIPGEPIFFAWSLPGNGALAPGRSGAANGFDGLVYAGRSLAYDWGLARLLLEVPASVSGTTVYFKAIAPNRRLSSAVVAKPYF